MNDLNETVEAVVAVHADEEPGASTPEMEEEYKEAQDFKPSSFVVSLAHFQKLKSQREEAIAELAAMREAVAVTQALAEWSARYPRGFIYSASNCQMDAELIELEERAKAATAKLQPFIK